MGFASYDEDIQSRFFQATRIRNKEHDAMIKDTVRAQPAATKLKAFTAPQPRPLPVIVLADTSGSMAENGKIDALNVALCEMIQSFAKESRLRAEIHVGLITFGGKEARQHLPLIAAHRIEGMQALQASGATPMGAAFTLACELLENKDLIPSRAYRPVVVLVSDGAPNDNWEAPLEALKASERGSKATRFSLAIGADADREMLAIFANDREAPVFEAHEVRDIMRFFRAVTMSVVTRSSSATPDQAVSLELDAPLDDDDLDIDAL